MSDAYLSTQFNPIVIVTVELIRPSRIIVVLEDGRKGIIPEREWTWDRSRRREIPSFIVGQRLDAVLLEEKSRPNQAYLSLCAKEDPWEKLFDQYTKGKIVSGEVVNLRRFAAFVQLEPGITAIIWAKDLPLKGTQIPSDILSMGDKLSGLVTFFDKKKQKIEISVNHLLHLQAEEDLDHLIEMNKERFGEILHSSSSTVEIQKESQTNLEFHQIQGLEKLESVLIIDDTTEHRQMLTNCLKNNFDLQILDVAECSREAKDYLQKRRHYDLIILDINLSKQESGVQLAREFLKEDTQLNIIFVSNDPTGEKQLQQLEQEFNRDFLFAFKENGLSCGSLLESIDDLQRGIVKKTSNIRSSSNDFSRQIGLSRKSEAQALQELLMRLVVDEKLSYAFLLELKTGTRKVELVSRYPNAEVNLFETELDALYYSPVRQVIEEDEEVYFTHVSPLGSIDDRRLKNLFPNLAYQACFGIPIHLLGQSTKYALFVLDQIRPVLDRRTRDKILQCALYLGAVMERSAVLDYLLKSADPYYKGQLLGSLVHELNNKMDPLRHHLGKGESNLMENNWEAASKQLREVHRIADSLQQLLNAYARLAGNKMERVNMNTIAEKVVHQQKSFASEKGIELYLDFDKNLPAIKAVPHQIEQIIANVLLNAIQQIEEQRLSFHQIDQERKNRVPENYHGAVFVKTAYQTQRKICTLTVIDTGPGIPFNQQETVFEWGMTTRQHGQGMGLYISRSLAEAMGGQLKLADTIRFIGSAFVMEFPVH